MSPTNFHSMAFLCVNDVVISKAICVADEIEEDGTNLSLQTKLKRPEG